MKQTHINKVINKDNITVEYRDKIKKNIAKKKLEVILTAMTSTVWCKYISKSQEDNIKGIQIM